MEDLEEKYRQNEALSVPMGLIRAVGVLREHLGRGATIVGANVTPFDLTMLRRSYGAVLGRDLLEDLALERFPVIDVIKHDEVIESRSVSRRARSLTSLCRHYGVAPGGHNALSDARASVEVFLAQVHRNDVERRAASPQIPFELEFGQSCRSASGS